jgi:hypothetical protein
MNPSYMTGSGSMVLLLIIFVAAVFLFVLGRAVLLWYFRINEAIYELKDINARLKHIKQLLRSNAPQAEPESEPSQVA